MGAASGMERLKSVGRLDSFMEATSLARWQKHGFRQAYMAKQLHEFSATRFHRKAATRLRLIATASDAVSGVRVVVYTGLSPVRESDVLRQEVIARFNKHLGRKSVSDFMIETGLSQDVIALDQRVVGCFNQYFGYRHRFNSIQSSHGRYISVESALREACSQRGITLGKLDRIFFRFSGMSAVEFFIRY
jgi:thermostable 8-oxoguanine DNA glycosylase